MRALGGGLLVPRGWNLGILGFQVKGFRSSGLRFKILHGEFRVEGQEF